MDTQYIYTYINTSIRPYVHTYTHIYILSLKPGGPAEKAGMRLGDQIWELDGGSVKHLGHDSVRLE